MTDIEIPDWIKEAMARTDEPLVPELADCLSESEFLGQVLKHPLVFQVPFFEARAYLANDQLAAKKTALKEALKDKNWHTAIWLHERPFRVQSLQSVAQRLTDEEYWDLTGMVYADTENFWQEARRWEWLLTSSRPHREMFMDEDEREFFAALPDEITVYRGFNGRGKRASWAWTLDHKTAEYFAHRLHDLERGGKVPTVTTATVAKTDAIAYLSRRNESELVVPPKKVIYTRTEKL